MLDDEQRVARRLQAVERREQRLAVGRMQARRRLVEHVDDAEQVASGAASPAAGAAVRPATASACAIEREVAEAESTAASRGARGGRRRCAAPRCAFLPTGSACAARRARPRAPSRRRRRAARSPRASARLAARGVATGARACARSSARGGRPQELGDALKRQPRERADVEPGEGHRQRLALQPLAVARRADRADHEARRRAFSSARSASSRTYAARSCARR